MSERIRVPGPVMQMRVVNDSLANLVSGMGTARDKTMHTMFALDALQRDQLENAYRGDWIARKVVDIPAQDATREWRNWQADSNDITALEGLEKIFSIQNKVKRLLQKARLYGGAALILGVDQGKMDEALDLTKIKKGQLKFVHVVSRYDVTAGPIDGDIMSPFYGEPQYYDRMSAGTGNLFRIHPSRVVRIVGMEAPDPLRVDGWGDSVLQSVQDAVKSAGSVTQSVAHLVQESQTDILRIPNLTKNMSTQEGADRLLKRFAYAAEMKSLYKMLLLDKDEEWQRLEANFSGMPDLLKMYLLIASGAADIPATRMLSQSPSGLSATGESDIRNYYDKVASDQKNELQPALARLDEVLIRSALGVYPEDIFYLWNSLWQLDDTGRADLAHKKAQTFQIDAQAGLIDQAVLKRARENQLIEDGTYPGLEGIIEEEELFGAEEDEVLALPPPDKQEELAENILSADAKARIKQAFFRRNRIKRDRMKRSKMLSDAKFASLYVSRKVLNADEIIKHFKGQGFKTTMPADQLHVTIVYSREMVEWTKVGDADWGQDEKGQIRIAPGGMRCMALFGPDNDVVVLQFNSSNLAYRHQQIYRETEGSWDWGDYQPHITITLKGPKDLSKVEPWQGEIILGPEIFAEVKEDAMRSVKEDHKVL